MALIGPTDGPPKSGDSLLGRVCKALDLSPRQLAAAIDVPYSEIAPLLSPYVALSDLDRTPMWWVIFGLINDKTALLLAARAELDKRLQKDRAKRAAYTSDFSRRKTTESLRDIRK